MPQKEKIRPETKSKLLEGLNEEQIQAVTHGQGPLLIVAGAGTGKTTVITRRIAYLIEQGAKPEEILALAFGEKAAAEMEERVDQLLPLGYYNLQISTFHSFGEQVLGEYGVEIGLPDFKVLDEVSQWLLVRNNLEKFNLDYYRPLGNPTRFIKALVTHFARAKDELISPEEYVDYAEKIKLAGDIDPSISLRSAQGVKKLVPELVEGQEADRVCEVANAYHVYQRLLLENTALDFGDLINYCLNLFRKRPQILEHYRNRFKYILVDEFQDTNFAQYELLKLLARPRNNLTVVGDDDQSIFKFRGASISNILHFQKDYPKAKFITLIENYRSHQILLDKAYKFIQQNNPDRLEVRLSLSKKLLAKQTRGGLIESITAPDYLSEAELVVLKILELRAQNPGSTWNDFAILARSHEALDPFLNELEKQNIPYLYFANKGLYRKPIILDILAYFKLLDNYHESQALYRVLNFPVFGIKTQSLVELGANAKKKTLSLYESVREAATLKNIDKTSLEGIHKFLTLLEKHSESARQKALEQVYVEVIRDLEIRRQINSDSAQGVQNAKFLETFLRRIRDFQNDPLSPDKTLKNFVSLISLELEAGELGSLEFDPEAGPEAVKVMTVHGAKGLEFTNVFVAGLVDKRFPTIERREIIEIPKELIKEILPVGDIHLEEERRLFYVAMTRAKENLYLARALDYGGKLAKKPSRFLVELGLVSKELTKPTGEVVFKPPKSPGTKFAIPKYFSFSQISVFRKCPLEYKYRYILKLPVPGAASLSFGLSIHRTLEKFLKVYKQNLGHSDLFGKAEKPKLPAFDFLKQVYRESWIDEWYDSAGQKQEYKKLGEKIIENFYQHSQKNPPLPKFLEQKFRLKIDDAYLLGKIDRADDSPKGLLIIDYKTGQKRTRLSPVDKQQLLLYQLAAENFLHEKVADLQYWYLKDTLESAAFLGTETELRELLESFKKTIEEIQRATATNNFYNLDQRLSHECQYRNLE